MILDFNKAIRGVTRYLSLSRLSAETCTTKTAEPHRVGVVQAL